MHLAENSQPLTINLTSTQSWEELYRAVNGFNEVCVLCLPPLKKPEDYSIPLQGIGRLVSHIAEILGQQATLITLGEVVDLIEIQADMPDSTRYQHWIAIKRITPRIMKKAALPNYHFGALLHTKYKACLRHAKTRIQYTYCPSCDRTTKDYGGKKHVYHEYGTLISDIWRDIPCDLEGDITPIITRFADMLGMEPYQHLLVLDCRSIELERIAQQVVLPVENVAKDLPENLSDNVLQGDCLERFKEIPDNSIDFAFSDPPYNLGKTYLGYNDNLEIESYFNWCDRWILEMARVLKPGRTCAILNIPLWTVRHFIFMRNILTFQNWIVWDALAFPVRLIMPAHYAILCFSKGEPRELPGLLRLSHESKIPSAPKAFSDLEPLAEGYCLRSECVEMRERFSVRDRGALTDLWWDIHRLKHNTRRVDHPCQLPPHLMSRIISIFTKPGEVVLDCFNGAGTTTLVAHQLERHYLGIEVSEKYCDMARQRHREIMAGLDPFRKEERPLTAKNSPVPRLKKQKYKISKKALQLEARRVAKELKHLPTRKELSQYGKYPIEYYDQYFVSWGEVCAAARTTGMTEHRLTPPLPPAIPQAKREAQEEFCWYED